MKRLLSKRLAINNIRTILIGPSKFGKDLPTEPERREREAIASGSPL